MKCSLSLILTLLIAIALAPTTLSAQTIPDTSDSDTDDSAPVTRVARLRFVDGDVSFLRAGTSEWASAIENLPLLAGDQIYVGRDGRAEIQISGGSFIRLLDETTLTISELSDSAFQFEVTEGTALISVDRLVSESRFEIDTPNSALLLTGNGLYKLSVLGPQVSEVIVGRGLAEISTDDGTVRVREGYRLTVDTGLTGQLQMVADAGTDWWNDRWVSGGSPAISRTAQSPAPDYVTNYESNYSSFYGASDLSSYGSWTNDSSYGYCWVPRVDSNWAPYRYGQWLWIPTVGWAWVPGFRSGPLNRYNWDYRWRPALVYFFNYRTNRGTYVGWYPLSPRERWHRPEWYNRHGDHARLQPPTPRDGGRRPGDNRRWIDPPHNRRAVTCVPAEAFQRRVDGAKRSESIARDSSNWNNPETRPGLPAMTPLPASTRGDAGRVGRKVVSPPAYVVERPVVTRSRPTNAETESSVPRERRLISPGPSRNLNGGSSHIWTDESLRSGRKKEAPANEADGLDRNKTREDSRKYRIQVPTPSNGSVDYQYTPQPKEATNEKAEQRKLDREERRQRREQDRNISPVTPPNNQGEQPHPRADNREGHREPRVESPAEQPHPRVDNRERPREPRNEPPPEQPHPRVDNRERPREPRNEPPPEQPHPRVDNRERPREPRNEPRAEQPHPRTENREQPRELRNEPRTERKPEKQERQEARREERQAQREQRRKP